MTRPAVRSSPEDGLPWSVWSGPRDRRVEALVFVRDPRIKQYLVHTVLDTLLADNDRAMELGTNGCYTMVEVAPRVLAISAQEELLRRSATSEW